MGWEFLTSDEILMRLIAAALSGLAFAYARHVWKGAGNDYR